MCVILKSRVLHTGFIHLHGHMQGVQSVYEEGMCVLCSIYTRTYCCILCDDGVDVHLIYDVTIYIPGKHTAVVCSIIVIPGIQVSLPKPNLRICEFAALDSPFLSSFNRYLIGYSTTTAVSWHCHDDAMKETPSLLSLNRCNNTVRVVLLCAKSTRFESK